MVFLAKERIHVYNACLFQSDVKGTVIGYMYEFDCKPVAKVPAKDAMWIQLAFEKQVMSNKGKVR